MHVLGISWLVTNVRLSTDRDLPTWWQWEGLVTSRNGKTMEESVNDD
jgi:hypothetical protein